VLGPKRLPGLARSLGKGLAEFRRASTDMRREFLDVAEEVRIDPSTFSTEPDPEPEAPAAATEPEPGEAPAEPTGEPAGEPSAEQATEPSAKRSDD
jgi:Sec-independent protein translocase protein TatA